MSREPVVYDGKKLYRVEQTYSWEGWVLAENEDAALADADELFDSSEMEFEDSYASVQTKIPESSGFTIWTGGPDGDDIFPSELADMIAAAALSEDTQR